MRAQLVREASSVSQCNLKDFDWDAKVHMYICVTFIMYITEFYIS